MPSHHHHLQQKPDRLGADRPGRLAGSSLGRSPHAPWAGLLSQGSLLAHQRSPTVSARQFAPAGRVPALARGGDPMTPAPASTSQKTASGWPPVAPKNLPLRPAGASPQQKSRPVAAPRRSV